MPGLVQDVGLREALIALANWVRRNGLDARCAAPGRSVAGRTRYVAARRDDAGVDGMAPFSAQDLAEVLGIGLPGGQRLQPERGHDQLERRSVLERAIALDAARCQV